MEPKNKHESDDGAKSPSIHLDIIQHGNGTRSGNLANDNWGSNFYEPQRDLSDLTAYGSSSSSRSRISTSPTPEKQLTLFALYLAILEKAASGLGTLCFIWATVVLLGGFASTIQTIDFWFITVILLIEGTRIFSRSHEIEWQHQSTTWPLASTGQNRFQKFKSSSRFFVRAIKVIFHPLSIFQSKNRRRSGRHISSDSRRIPTEENASKWTWHTSNVTLLLNAGWILRNFSSIFYWLQLVSAAACTSLSLTRLIQQDYEEKKGGFDTKNLSPALNIFYGLALSESLLFLMEKAYWNWKIGYNKLLDKICLECDLGPYGIVSITRFFYDSYSRCIEGSIFDGLNMDLVTFSIELLDSNSRDEHLIGAQILETFVSNEKFSGYTLRKIGTSTPVIERLIEMLNWKDPVEEKIRRSAAKVVSKLAGKKHNALRVAEIPGAMESISSLLHTGRNYTTRPHEIGQRLVVADRNDYEYSVFNLLGLLILKKLSHDHDNCFKIGNARGLMPKIIDFTATSENLLRNDLALESQIKTVKRSLKLVKTLVSTTGNTGKMLRKEISEIVFTVSNIRDTLQYGERHLHLQKLGIEVLTSLAIDEEARERIGSTGGIIRLLLLIFFKPLLTEEQSWVSVEAGEALAMLAFGNKTNCKQILMEEDVIIGLINSLNNPLLKVNSSRILRNLCAYSGPEYSVYLKGVTAVLPAMLKEIMEAKDKLLEVSLGLATQILQFVAPEEYAEMLASVGVTDFEFAGQLIQILKSYRYPDIKVPRIRRFIIELKILMMKSQGKYIQLFKDLEADEVLKGVAETTSELESFNVFSGSVGLDRSNITVSSLVDTARKFIE